MSPKEQESIQREVTQYFKEESNQTMIQLIEAFIYGIPTKNPKIGILVDKFLKDSGLTDAYINYIVDSKHDEERFFKRSSMSEVELINNVKIALLNDSFNRFKTTVEVASKFNQINKKYKELKGITDVLMDAGSTEKYHEAMDDLRDLYIK